MERGNMRDAVKIDWEHTEAHFTTDVWTELGELAAAGKTVPRRMETWLRVALDAESDVELLRWYVPGIEEAALNTLRVNTLWLKLVGGGVWRDE